MNTMNVTIDSKDGFADVFTIEFKSSDFMVVVDAIDNLTIEKLHSSDLWKVI
jgi:hypothetical protein